MPGLALTAALGVQSQLYFSPLGPARRVTVFRAQTSLYRNKGGPVGDCIMVLTVTFRQAPATIQEFKYRNDANRSQG